MPSRRLLRPAHLCAVVGWEKVQKPRVGFVRAAMRGSGLVHQLRDMGFPLGAARITAFSTPSAGVQLWLLRSHEELRTIANDELDDLRVRLLRPLAKRYTCSDWVPTSIPEESSQGY